jgi:hypothetical protein
LIVQRCFDFRLEFQPNSHDGFSRPDPIIPRLQ